MACYTLLTFLGHIYSEALLQSLHIFDILKLLHSQSFLIASSSTPTSALVITWLFYRSIVVQSTSLLRYQWTVNLTKNGFFFPLQNTLFQLEDFKRVFFFSFSLDATKNSGLTLPSKLTFADFFKIRRWHLAVLHAKIYNSYP